MCSCLYFNFIQEYLSFLFSIIFKFVIFFSDFTFIYTATFYAILVFIRVFALFEQIYSLLDVNSQFIIGQEIEHNKAVNFYLIVLQDFND